MGRLTKVVVGRDSFFAPPENGREEEPVSAFQKGANAMEQTERFPYRGAIDEDMAIRINRSTVGKPLGLLHRIRSFLKSADGLFFSTILRRGKKRVPSDDNLCQPPHGWNYIHLCPRQDPHYFPRREVLLLVDLRPGRADVERARWITRFAVASRIRFERCSSLTARARISAPAMIAKAAIASS